MNNGNKKPEALSAKRLELLALLMEEEEALVDEGGPSNNIFPLSYAQQRLWFVDQMEGANVIYNFPTALRVKGPIDWDLFTRCLQRVRRRHPVITASFQSQNGTPMQVFNPDREVTIPVVCLMKYDNKQQRQEVARLLKEEAAFTFDLEKGELQRSTLVRLAKDEHILLSNMHHIITDGWSSSIFVKEIMALYVAGLQGHEAHLPSIGFHYGDFVHWQNERLAGENREKLLTFWRSQLRGAPLLALPLDRPREELQSQHGDLVTLAIPLTLANKLRELGQKTGASLFMTLLAAFKVLLCRYSGQTDIVVGTSAACRPMPELEQLIGLFVNQLVLRSELSGNPDFIEILKRVTRTTTAAFAHQEMPFDTVVAEVAEKRQPGVSPLFQVLFLLHNFPQKRLEASDEISIEPIEIETETARFDLSLTVEEVGDELTVKFIYKSDLFERATISRMADSYHVVLENIVANPHALLTQIEVQSTADKQLREQAAKEKQKLNAGRFKKSRRKAVDLAQMQLVAMQEFATGKPFPLLVTPTSDAVNLAEWALTQQKLLEDTLYRHGAILFRGFNINDEIMFEEFARSACTELKGDYGDLPKESKGEKIYKSTPYPNEKTILYHNESSHTHQWPMKQFFSCMVVAEEGGETPIVDCREVYKKLDPAILQRIAEKKLLYVRNFIEGLDVSWQNFFKTDSREVAEQKCREQGLEYEWTGKNNLRTKQIAQGITLHPVTGESLFFNQVQLHHISCMESHERESLLTLFKPEELPRNVYYGDGTPISDDVMAEIGRVYDACAVKFLWQKGDVIMVDNMIAAHARLPFKGERKVIVAMGDVIMAKDVAATMARMVAEA